MFVAPTSQASMQSPPARKKLKLADATEKSTMCADDAMGYRRRIMEHKMKRMRAIREKYAENASELFFLHAGGNMMDFQTWRKRPPTPQYLHFLRQHRLDRSRGRRRGFNGSTASNIRNSSNTNCNNSCLYNSSCESERGSKTHRYKCYTSRSINNIARCSSST